MIHERSAKNHVPGRPVTITINNRQISAEEGEVILPVAVREGIPIPHLCFEESLAPYGACRLCLVEAGKHGKREMTTACTLRAAEGLEILTNTPGIGKHQSILFELYLAEAPKSEVIREMAARYGVTKTRFLKKMETSDPLGGKCMLCGLCVRACNEIMGAGAINFINRGPYTVVNTPFREPSTDCYGCGACVNVCPTHAIQMEDSGGERVMKSWSGTRVPLVQCTRCGTYYAPRELAARTLAVLDPQLERDIASLCPVCRGRRIAENEILARFGGTDHRA